MVKQKEDENRELLDAIKELGVTFGPLLLRNKEIEVPIIKRQQWINFVIMMTICIGVILLAFSKVIDGSAATGLIGAVIGYVFGYLYSKKEK